MSDYNRDVLEAYARERIEELKAEGAQYFNDLLRDGEIHFKVFNEDYYIIYYSDAIEWMSSHGGNCFHVWEVLARVQEYENENFGELATDLSNPVDVVNVYAYIVGEEIIQELDLQPMEEIEEE